MREKILNILQDIRPDIDFENETGLISEGVLESFDLLGIIASIEDTMGVEVDTGTLSTEDFDSLESIIQYVERITK